MIRRQEQFGMGLPGTEGAGGDADRPYLSRLG
jgi:hypothetical protein